MSKKSVLFLCSLALACGSVNAQEHQNASVADSLKTKSGKGDNRNVMLNAADSYKPREIQIGLPSEDVNVYENGLPAVYSSSVHKLSAHWRNDASLKGTSLMSPAESAIATGNMAYTVNAESELGIGDKRFQGVLNYHANHFGLQNFDLNLSGRFAPNWYWTASMYQNFDPGTQKQRYTSFADRTQIYHAGITHVFNEGRGKMTLLYKYSYSKNPGNFNNQGPFVYNGDGSISKFQGFKLGRYSYVPNGGHLTYYDIMDGQAHSWDFQQAMDNHANELAFLFENTFNNGWKWTLNAKYMDAPRANYVDFGGSTISQASAFASTPTAAGLDLTTDEAGLNPYSGYVEGRRTWLHFGKVRSFMLTTEVNKRLGSHNLRIGLNEWYYHLNYHSSSFQWYASANEYPTILYGNYYNPFTGLTRRSQTYDFNELSPEYTKGTENKLAAYFTDTWQVTPRFKLLYGARLEYYRMSADQISAGRYNGFYIGGTNAAGQVIAPANVTKNKLNYAATIQGTYKLTDNFGLLADASVATRFPRISDYAGSGPTDEQYKRVTIPLIRGGFYYKNKWLDLTSMVSYISKSNNIDQQNLTNPGTSESKTVLLIYNIHTLGWTTSAEIDPFKNFHLHALFTWQKPQYSNYNASVTFNNGNTMSVNADKMIVKEIPQVLIELDPSYQITPSLRAWLSFRYFGKTYANLQEAFYFDGHWETFGGINWQVNKKLSLGVDVVNIFNVTGAKGTINGTELVTKANAASYAGYNMSGSYLRPFTVEFSASLRF